MPSNSQKMLEALSQNDLLEAQMRFQEALRSDSLEELYNLGEELLHLGFLEESKEVYTRLKKEIPTEYEFNISLAEIAIENDEIESAFELLEEIPKTDSAYVPSLLTLADLYQILEIPEVSEAKLKEARNIMPEEPIVKFALAELSYSMGKIEEAIQFYRELLTDGCKEISRISIEERLGSALSYSGEFEEGIQYLEKALKKYESDDALFQLAITYIQVGEREKAISLLQQLRLTNPRYNQLYLPLASAMQDENLKEEAEEVIIEGLQQNPFSIDLFHLASDNAFSLNKVDLAEEFLRKAISLEEDKEYSLIKLSHLLLSEERYEDTVETLSEIKESTHPHAYWCLAQANNGMERFAEAAENYKKAYQIMPHEPDFLKDYGLFLREEGQSEQSTEILKQYLQHEPEDIEIYSLIEE